MGFLDQSGGYSFIPLDTDSKSTVITPTAKSPEQLINELRGEASKFINTQISSANSFFDKTGKNLASSISKQLGSVFGDKTIASAATSTTKVSDPVSNLLKTPISKTFKLDSLQTGSGVVGGTSTVSQSGTLANLMIGTQLSTVLERFSLDTKDALGSVITTKSYQDGLSGLFGTFDYSIDALGTTTPGIVNGNIPVDLKSSVFGQLDVKIDVSELAKDVKDIENVTNNLDPSLAGGNDIFSFYTKNVTSELINANGDIVPTSKFVSSPSANSVLGLIKRAGCYLANEEYKSALDTKSFFNLGMISAAAKGMIQELTDLVSCTQSSTIWGQTILRDVLTSNANTNVDVLPTLMEGIIDKTSLQVNDVDTLIFTNPNLDASDASTVSGLLDDLNSSASDVLTITNVSSDAYPVWDTSLMRKVKPSFLDAILTSGDMTNYLDGRMMRLDQSGHLV